MCAVVVLAPGLAGAAADSFKDVIVRNTPDQPVPTQAVGTTPVEVTNQPAAPPAAQPWQKTIRLVFTGPTRFAFATVDVPDDQAITIEHVGVPDLFGLEIAQLDVSELCDFSDGQSGFGGLINVPTPLTRTGGTQGLDHLTKLHLTPGACLQIGIELVQEVAAGGTLSFSLTLSGTSTPVPAAAVAAAGAEGESLEERVARSRKDPAFKPRRTN